MRFLKYVLYSTLVFAILLAALLCVPFKKTIMLTNAESISITHPPILAVVFDYNPMSECDIRFRNGSIVFYEGYNSEPDLIFPSADGRAFFCLYNRDTSEPLFKIDPSKPFDAADASYNVKWLIRRSSWDVQEATPADWQYAEKYIANLDKKVFGSLIIPKHRGDPNNFRYVWLKEIRRSNENILNGEPPVPLANQK